MWVCVCVCVHDVWQWIKYNNLLLLYPQPSINLLSEVLNVGWWSSKVSWSVHFCHQFLTNLLWIIICELVSMIVWVWPRTRQQLFKIPILLLFIFSVATDNKGFFKSKVYSLNNANIPQQIPLLLETNNICYLCLSLKDM